MRWRISAGQFYVSTLKVEVTDDRFRGSGRGAAVCAAWRTGKLDYPFRVNREGPGRYQVLFSYASEVDRLDVLDQVNFVTGQQKQ